MMSPHSIAHADPRANPATTSENQCTPKTTREAATATASTTAAQTIAIRTARGRPRDRTSAMAV